MLRQVNFQEAIRLISAAAAATAKETNNGDLTCQETAIPDDNDLIVFGDLHGEYRDFCTKFERVDTRPETTRYVFMGDLIDGRDPETRNEFDLLNKIAKLKAERGDRVIMLLGNHELMGFSGKNPRPSYLNTYLWQDYAGSDAEKAAYVKALLEWYLVSPIMAIATRKKRKIAMVHGGPGFGDVVQNGSFAEFQMPKDAVYSVEALNKVAKRKVMESRVRKTSGPQNLQIFAEGIETDELIPGTNYSFYQALEELLWSDVSETGGVLPNFTRGKLLRKLYGPVVTEKFLALNGLDFLVRGHQPRKTDFFDQKQVKVVSTNFRLHQAHRNRVVTMHHSKRSDLKPLYTCVLTWRKEDAEKAIKIERDDEMIQLIGVAFDTWGLLLKPDVFEVSRYTATSGKIGRVSDFGFPETWNRQNVDKKMVAKCEPGDVLLFEGNPQEKMTGIVGEFVGRMTHVAIIAIDQSVSKDRENTLTPDEDGSNVIVLESNRYPASSKLMKYDYFGMKMSRERAELEKETDLWRAKQKRAAIERMRHARDVKINESPDQRDKRIALDVMGTKGFLPEMEWEAKNGVRSTTLREFLRFYDGGLYLCKLPQSVVNGISGGRQTLNYRLLANYSSMRHLEFEEDTISFVKAYFKKPFRDYDKIKSIYCSEFVARIMQLSGLGLSKGKDSELYTPSDFDNSPGGKEQEDFVISQTPLLISSTGKAALLGLPESLFEKAT